MTIAERGRRITEDLEALIERAERLRGGTRRDGARELPLGPKATRTRATIIDAGIEVFCELGYSAGSITDVHERAGVSLGTFYQYFRDKADLTTTIVAEHVLGTASRVFPGFDHTRGVESVRTVVSAFVRHYAATADFQRVWEEITHIDPEVAEFRHEMGAALEASLAADIAAGQAAAVVDAGLDPARTARALAAMVDRTCYLTFVVERAGRDAVPDTVEQLTALWANALRLTPDA